MHTCSGKVRRRAGVVPVTARAEPPTTRPVFTLLPGLSATSRAGLSSDRMAEEEDYLPEAESRCYKLRLKCAATHLFNPSTVATFTCDLAPTGYVQKEVRVSACESLSATSGIVSLRRHSLNTHIDRACTPQAPSIGGYIKSLYECLNTVAVELVFTALFAPVRGGLWLFKQSSQHLDPKKLPKEFEYYDAYAAYVIADLSGRIYLEVLPSAPPPLHVHRSNRTKNHNIDA